MTVLIRTLSGVISGGLVATALAVIIIAIMGSAPSLSGMQAFAGPGAESITVHICAALLAVVAQVFADKRKALTAFVVLVLVTALAGAVLWTQWLN
jgi:hypothetical protein